MRLIADLPLSDLSVYPEVIGKLTGVCQPKK